MKTNMFPRYVCIAVLFLLALPAIVHAQFTVNYGPGGATITGYNGPGGTVMIPNNYTNGVFIIGIGTNAFANCSNLTAIAFSSNVTNIGALAFSNCTNLMAAYFSGNAPPDTGNAFYGDTNAVVYYQSGTTGWNPTFGGAPTMMETPSSDFGFYLSDNSIISHYSGTNPVVVIPASDNDSPIYPYNTFFVTGIGGLAGVFGPGVTSIIIPYTVTNIAPDAFEGCGTLTNVFIPDSVISIGATAFLGDGKLTSITIPNSVTSIAEYTFQLCSGLDSVSIPNSVTSIGEEAFGDCRSLTSVAIPGSVTNIGENAFYGCSSLTSVTIPGSVTTIGPGAFQSCGGLTNVTIANGVISVGTFAFAYCDMANVSIPASVTNIGVEAFDASLTNISVDPANPSYSSFNGVLFDKELDTIIFYPQGLSGPYTIPNSVTNIGFEAFDFCANLTSVSIPASVTGIGAMAFFGSTSLTNISVDPANPSYSSLYGVLFDEGKDTILDYPAGLTGPYIIPNSVTNIGTQAFAYGDLTSVSIPGSVISVGSEAFYSCFALTSAYFEGNAPTNDGTAFASDHKAVVYYLPGTTGWGPTFGGVPAELWNPQATAYTTTGGQFGFNITGPTNATIVVESCTNLVNPVWLPVSTNTLSGSGTSPFSDPQGMNYPNRYYRFSAP